MAFLIHIHETKFTPSKSSTYVVHYSRMATLLFTLWLHFLVVRCFVILHGWTLPTRFLIFDSCEHVNFLFFSGCSSYPTHYYYRNFFSLFLNVCCRFSIPKIFIVFLTYHICILQIVLGFFLILFGEHVLLIYNTLVFT